jgi:hypothetical protein
MAAGFDGELQVLGQSCNIYQGASGLRTGERSNLETEGRLACSFNLPRVFSWS